MERAAGRWGPAVPNPWDQGTVFPLGLFLQLFHAVQNCSPSTQQVLRSRRGLWFHSSVRVGSATRLERSVAGSSPRAPAQSHSASSPVSDCGPKFYVPMLSIRVFTIYSRSLLLLTPKLSGIKQEQSFFFLQICNLSRTLWGKLISASHSISRGCSTEGSWIYFQSDSPAGCWSWAEAWGLGSLHVALCMWPRLPHNMVAGFPG